MKMKSTENDFEELHMTTFFVHVLGVSGTAPGLYLTSNSEILHRSVIY